MPIDTLMHSVSYTDNGGCSVDYRVLTLCRDPLHEPLPATYLPDGAHRGDPASTANATPEELAHAQEVLSACCPICCVEERMASYCENNNVHVSYRCIDLVFDDVDDILAWTKVHERDGTRVVIMLTAAWLLARHWNDAPDGQAKDYYDYEDVRNTSRLFNDFILGYSESRTDSVARLLEYVLGRWRAFEDYEGDDIDDDALRARLAAETA